MPAPARWVRLTAAPLGCVAWSLLLLGAGFPGPADRAKLTDKQRTQIAEPRPPGMPTDAELEAAGAVIGKVEIDIRNIFDENDPRENSGLYKLADRLHVRTKPATIRAQLLFKSGDRYSARNLAETERNLRTLVFIYDARVVPVRFVDGKVDVRVITRDVWTFDPNVSFGRTGGSNSTSASLQEENFLGWGKQLEVGRTSNVDAPARSPSIRTRMCSARAGPVGSLTSIRATAASARPRSRNRSIPSIRGGARRCSGKATIARYPAIFSATSPISSTTTRRPI